MKLLHVRQARSIWLFDIQDLNPRGKSVLGAVVDWIGGRYSFADTPDLEKILKEGSTDLPSAGLVFQRGSFQAREDLFLDINCFTIYNDGVVVDTAASTQDGDQFLGDLLAGLAREFGLTYDPAMIRKRLYLSTLIVQLQITLDAGYPELASFAGAISEAVHEASSPFRFAGISFWTEPNDAGNSKTFSLMPQAGRPFAENRYFSEAPLKTDDHYRLLEELEKTLTKR
ncbi:MAG: hypothetical protein IT165_23540 [Bryobacterales bacterium]|nr:hypothetical protein [Bryobacterales bacterium]